MPKIKVTAKRRKGTSHTHYPVVAMGKAHSLFLGNGDKPADTLELDVTDQELTDALHDPFLHAEEVHEGTPALIPDAPVDPGNAPSPQPSEDTPHEDAGFKEAKETVKPKSRFGR